MGSIAHDKTVRVWDVEKSTAVYTYDKLTSKPNNLRWSPDGKFLSINETNGSM
jgi:WD40 repeat protein